MKIDTTDFRVPEGTVVDLNKWPTKVKPLWKSKKPYPHALKSHVEALSELQRLRHGPMTKKCAADRLSDHSRCLQRPQDVVSQAGCGAYL